MHVLALLGSLRKGSFNRMALNAAIELAPQEMTFEIADISEVPPYNQDVEDAGIPPVVNRLKEQIKQADAILFATPEYNYSMPGLLKNAIDWASRPPKENPFNGKPCAIMSASTGMLGGARAQYHLRQSCVFVNLIAMNRPEVIISKAAEKFDQSGKLTDEATRKILTVFMKTFEEWAKRMQ
jgi:chromate reductase, NAD(P)H dehydrogenase (quinone)